MATQIGSDDAIVTDFQSTCAAEMCKLSQPYMLSDTDAFARIIEGERNFQKRIGTNPGIISDEKPLASIGCHVHGIPDLNSFAEVGLGSSAELDIATRNLSSKNTSNVNSPVSSLI
jgi:hypothetical protein